MLFFRILKVCVVSEAPIRPLVVSLALAACAVGHTCAAPMIAPDTYEAASDIITKELPRPRPRSISGS